MKKGPYILLTTLFLILVFIVGVRYGQRVEKTNKTISYLLSVTPKKISPTQTALEFKTYVHKSCGVQFLYPNSLTAEKETTQSAQFGQNNQTQLSFSCEKINPFIASLKEPNIATKEVMLQGRKIQTSTFTQNNDTFLVFETRSTFSGKSIFFMIEQSLYPLLDNSLKFSVPK